MSFPRYGAVLAFVSILAPLATVQAQEPGGDDFARTPAATGPKVFSSVLLDVTRAAERIITVGEHGIVLLSDDEGRSWHQARVPVDLTLTSVWFTDARRGWAAGHGATILATGDGGETWHLQQFRPDLEAPLLDIWFPDDSTGFAVGANGMLFSTSDAGETWAFRELALADGFKSHLFAISGSDGSNLYIAAEAGTLYRSTNAGTDWEQLPSPYDGSFFGIMPLEDDRLLAYGMLGHVFLSRDDGATWTEIPSGTTQSFMHHRIENDRLMLVGLAGAILVSRDQGNSFKTCTAPRIDIAGILPVQEDELLLVGPTGPRRISDCP